MKSVKIKSIREGMVTATEVKDRVGRILLASGITITEKHLKIFKTWGITEVKIKTVKRELPTSDDIESKKEVVDPLIIKELDQLFQFTDRRHPVMDELYSLCLSRKVKSRYDAP